MNKKLLAVAVAGALGAPVIAFAQSSVTLYGSVDVAYANKVDKRSNGSTLSSVQGVGEGWQAGNRIGFRGTEDLGGGMSAQFLIEQGINITRGQLFSTRAAAAGQQYDGVLATGSTGNMPTAAYSTATNRQSFVGVKGGWGELLGGYQYTTLYRISTLSGYFVGSEQPGGDIMHTLDNANFGGTRANGVVYNSPIFADGFQVTGQWGAGAGPAAANFDASQADGKWQNNARRWSFMPTYNKGPLSAALGYTRFRAQSNGTLFPNNSVAAGGNLAGISCLQNILGVCITNPSTASGNPNSNLRSHVWQLAGSYQLGAWKFSGEYLNGKKRDDGTATIAAGAAGINAAVVAGQRTQADVRSKGWEGGVEFTAGAWRPFVMLSRSRQDSSGSVLASATGRTGDYKEWQFGVRYDLSKRTMLYVMAGQSKDTSPVVGNAPVAPAGASNAGLANSAGLRTRDGAAAGMYMSF